MREKFSDFDLAAAVIDRKGTPVDEEIVPPSKRTLQAVARGGRRSPGGIWIPVQIVAKMAGATAYEWAMIDCLAQLEYRAEVKKQPLTLLNIAAERFGISRTSKRRILDRLATRGILTYSQTGRKAAVVTVCPHFW